jgi:hypothetical protein
MGSSFFDMAIADWTAQATMASGFLVHLYRTLGDGRQQARVLEVRRPCEERSRHLGLQDRVPTLLAAFLAEYPDDQAREARAWQVLVEVHAGLTSFYRIAEPERGKGMGSQGRRSSVDRALHRSLQGYRAAFPDDMAARGICLAIAAAADCCSDAIALDMGIQDLRQELHACILDDLTRESLLGLAGRKQSGALESLPHGLVKGVPSCPVV